VNLVIDNRGVCSNNLVNDKERMPAHQGKGVTMIYINRYKRDFRRSLPNFAFFGLLGLFMLFICTPGHSGTIELPQTGQTVCYDFLGDIIPCLGTGQDGDILAGVAWPNPRFEIVNLACIVDNLTGLMWARDTSALAANWQQGVVNLPSTYFACGLDGWRIPNVNELQSLINAEQPDNVSWLEQQGFIFPFITDLSYWTSTSSAINPTVNAWVVDMVDGSVFPYNKGSQYFLWPVRGTSNPSTNIPPGQIAETGQIAQYATYDDAYFAITPTLNVGVPWPSPRFTRTFCDSTGPCAIQLADCDIDPDPSNDVITDNLTGLVWSGDANLGIIERPWAFALTYTNDLTVCGYADWRLPNSKELFSLVDRSQNDPALPVDHPFVRVKSGVLDRYWSSTTNAEIPTEAWAVGMLLGGLNPALKINSASVWPVRGGQTRPYLLTVKKEGDGQGKVTAVGLSCLNRICAGEYNSYEVVTVTAKAQGDSVFTGWGGGSCSGVVDTKCSITVTTDITITATFTPELNISVDPKSLNFKKLKKDVPSDTLTVTVTNVGVADLLISPPVIAGNFPSVFGQTNDCPPALASEAFCTISVTATSPDYDQKTAELQLVSNDPKKPTTIVKLKAKAKPPKIAKKPGNLNFGKVTLPGTADKTLTVTNKGITDLIIGTITITGDNPGDFSIVLPDACSGSTLVTDASCTLTLRFTPSVEDKRSAVLDIPSNDPKKQPALTVKLKGTGE
jgi:hypothetical protein